MGTDTLYQLWLRQIEFNERVRGRENPKDYEYWMKQYLLGATSEVNEILQEINWKIHRRSHPINRYNLARELADLTKFTWCLWEWSGFTAEEMLEFVREKTDELDAQFSQDWDTKIPQGASVVITDLDGTVGNWRLAFLQWTQGNRTQTEEDPASSLAMDVDMKIPYPEYARKKELFEAGGGYRTLPAYPDAVDALYTAAKVWNMHVISYTARPHSKHSRIWADTREWLVDVGLGDCVKELRIGGEERIVRACELMEEGRKVVMLEDDPGLAIRAASAGVKVILREQPYNNGVQHPNIFRTDFISSALILKVLEEGSNA